MTLEQFKKVTKEEQNEFLIGFKELEDNISDFVVDRIIEMRGYYNP
jgi:hypothetical protein